MQSLSLTHILSYRTVSLASVTPEQLADLDSEHVIVTLDPSLPDILFALRNLELLRRTCQEVVLQFSEDVCVVLFSTVPPEMYSRDDAIWIHSEILFEPPELPERIKKTVTFEISSAPKATADTYLDTCFFVKNNVRFAQEVLFEGDTDAMTALIAYALWIKYAPIVKIQDSQNIWHAV
ncbi:MAG: hypothetical protein COU35_02115 [Candidatus Magasanikbacteria bacterium CG10_big_fil_rev_8_21_14_0_10_47_10]|uniref:Uncharacterized protein n=1 Tax=Candidatus Magasanikbacteria bacterium CG10_big_fil_rev_8_21_14_0_10_47_10 TaxID=1974652 RepID=A0A2H0TSZ8_9BACT|nr:MAG: hypothetical protein COU35_02115 [Candidatus Magasanikbacteria bacterium CG10_big_fil_rev_8_21_14_0_10_47_10]